MLSLLRLQRAIRVRKIARDVGWDVILFVAGIFIMVEALKQGGLYAVLPPLPGVTFTALAAAGCSAVLNNHPTAALMATIIQQTAASDAARCWLVLASLIGGDLGPKMLPIGSLAAMLWLRLLRQRGIEVSVWQYMRLGIPITLSAVLVATLVLKIEMWLVYLPR